MKRLSSFFCALAALSISVLFSGCETPQENAALGAGLSGLAPYGKNQKASESLAAMGNAASGYANAQASQPQVTVNNYSQPQQEQQPPPPPQQQPPPPQQQPQVYSGHEVNPDGSEYYGEIRDGKRNGHGVFRSWNGKQYEGEWRDGKKEGLGILTLGGGERYEGEFRNDQMNGHGVYTVWTGAKYEGEPA